MEFLIIFLFMAAVLLLAVLTVRKMIKEIVRSVRTTFDYIIG